MRVRGVENVLCAHVCGCAQCRRAQAMDARHSLCASAAPGARCKARRRVCTADACACTRKHQTTRFGGVAACRHSQEAKHQCSAKTLLSNVRACSQCVPLHTVSVMYGSHFFVLCCALQDKVQDLLSQQQLMLPIAARSTYCSY